MTIVGATIKRSPLVAQSRFASIPADIASCGEFTPVLLSLISCSREIITCSDGGEVALDWFTVEGDGADTPTIIFLAGAHSSYRITVSLDLECYR